MIAQNIGIATTDAFMKGNVQMNSCGILLITTVTGQKMLNVAMALILHLNPLIVLSKMVSMLMRKIA